MTPSPVHVYYQTWLNDFGIIIGIIGGLIVIGATYRSYVTRKQREQTRRVDAHMRSSWKTKRNWWRR